MRKKLHQRKLREVTRKVLKFRPHYSVSYTQTLNRQPSGKLSLPPKISTPNGVLRERAARRVANAINWLILFSDVKTVYSIKEKKKFSFKLNFITLTLPTPQKHDDHYIKQHLLAPFLKWLERSHNVVSYLWKAEAQENGNIHFHITTNKFIHWKSIRSKWNKLLAAHGYCKVFQDGSNDKGDAATQIKAVKTTKGLVSYMRKYFTKGDMFKKRPSVSCPLDGALMTKRSYRTVQCSDGELREYKRPIDGKLWSCSYNMSRVNVFIGEENPMFRLLENWWLARNVKTTMRDNFCEIHIHHPWEKLKLHPEVKVLFDEARALFNVGDDRKRQIEIESFY